MFNVEHRRKVALLQLHLADEELCLSLCCRASTVEMIGATCEALFAGIIEIVLKVLVNLVGSFRLLNHNKTNGAFVDDGFVFQCCPVDSTLMVTDVNTVYLVAFRIAYLTIQGTPTETERTDENVVEEKDIDSNDNASSYPPCPPWQVL